MNSYKFYTKRIQKKVFSIFNDAIKNHIKSLIPHGVFNTEKSVLNNHIVSCLILKLTNTYI